MVAQHTVSLLMLMCGRWRAEERVGGMCARQASGAGAGPSSSTPRGAAADASTNYVFWDVGEDADSEKKKKRRAASGGSGAAPESVEDEDIPGWEKGKGKKGGASGKALPKKRGDDGKGGKGGKGKNAK